MNKKALVRTVLIISVFMLGFLASGIYAAVTTQSSNHIEKPADDNTNDQVPSPNDWISERQILVYSEQVVLDLKDAQWASFTDTHSMEPVLSSRSNAIEVVPKNENQIKVGDIVSYVSEYADGFIIHRVIFKGSDDQGTYFILKGDNNPDPDPGRIRFSQIQRVVVAIVY